MHAVKKITIDVHFTPLQSDELNLKDKNVVVIDVLRACTTAITALHNGAKEIIPVNTIESVLKISSSLFGDVTLRAGERNGKIIEGFNLGNSPREYTEEIVKGKSIIFMTTNGTSAIVKGRYAKNLLLAGFVNLSKAVEFLHHLQSDFVVICAGQDGRFCIEDAVCAGRLITMFQDKFDGTVIMDDAGAAAIELSKGAGKGILKMLKNSEHGKYLSEIGFADDLKVCSGIDTIPVLPVLSGNVVRALKEQLKRSA